MLETRYSQVLSDKLTVEKLPDGSTAVFDQRSKNVHSLNASATVVWEACKEGATLAEVRQALELRAGAPVGEAVAQSALAQLQSVKLIGTDDPALKQTITAQRRSSLLRLAAGLAVPVVLTLALSQQRAHAAQCLSCPR